MLGAQVLGHGERVAGRLRMDDELHEPGAVAQVDEDQPAVVAAAMDPAGDAHLVPQRAALRSPAQASR